MRQIGRVCLSAYSLESARPICNIHDRVHHLHFCCPKKKTLSIPTWTCRPSWPIAQVVGVITRKSQAHTQTHTQTVGESQVCVWLRRKARGRRQSSSGQVRFHRQSHHIWLPPQRGSVMIAVSVLPAIADAFPVETTHLRPKGPFLPILLNDMGTAARRSRKAGYRRGPY